VLRLSSVVARQPVAANGWDVFEMRMSTDAEDTAKIGKECCDIRQNERRSVVDG